MVARCARKRSRVHRSPTNPQPVSVARHQLILVAPASHRCNETENLFPGNPPIICDPVCDPICQAATRRACRVANGRLPAATRATFVCAVRPSGKPPSIIGTSRYPHGNRGWLPDGCAARSGMSARSAKPAIAMPLAHGPERGRGRHRRSCLPDRQPCDACRARPKSPAYRGQIVRRPFRHGAGNSNKRRHSQG